jgi:hypothetical protein
MQPGFGGERKQRMPSGMKFDFVDAMTVAVEGAQHRRIDVGGEAELYGFRRAQRLAERGEFADRPASLLAYKGRMKDAVGLQQIVRFERRRLVGDLVHRCVSQR